ncbi:MAG: hypothetical protein ABEJ74_01905 [Haloferacaceae archaeon]
MSQTAPIPPVASETAAATDLSQDEIFGVLSNQRRRYVLHYLKGNGGEATVRELTEQIAAWENDVDVAETTRQERKRVYTSLVQNHLNKMADLGVISYERDRVSLSDSLETVDIYLEVTSSSELPWSDYYVGLAALSLAFTVAVGLDVFPFSLVPGIGAALAVTVALLVSAVVHALYSRRKRIGGRGFLDQEAELPR